MVEGVDHPGVLLGYVGLAEMLAHHRAVLAFDKGIIVGFPCTRLGEFNEQFVEQLRHDLVHVLRPIVGVEAAQDEGERFEQRLKGREQERLTDTFHRGHDFKLRDLVYRIDMVDAFLPIEVTLMHGIDAQVTRLSLGPGFTALPDGNVHGCGLGPVPPAFALARCFAQVVEVGDRDAG